MRVSLGRNIIASGATAGMWILTALLTVPIVIHSVGRAGYGVWTVAQSLVIFTALAEAGLGTGVQRFVALARGAGDARRVRALAWTTLGGYFAVGAVVAGIAVLIAPSIVSSLDVPRSLHADAVTAFRLVGVVLLLALVANGLGNVQSGVERWITSSASVIVSLVVYVPVLALLADRHGLPGVAAATGIQQGVLLLLRAVDVRRVFLGGPPAIVSRGDAIQLFTFSLKTQASAFSSFANNQSDKIVVGLIAPAATVASVGVGSQVAEAGRALGGAALLPVVTRMTAVHGASPEDAAALRALYARLARLWTLTVVGVTVIGTASLHPLIAGWLGKGYGEAALLGSFLVVAAGINLLTGVATAYLRAVGRPGLEARYGLSMIALNVVLSIPLGIAFGPRGVVLGTLGAYVVGTAWFFVRFRPLEPAWGPGLRRTIARGLAGGLVAGAASLGWGLVVVRLLPAGFALPVVTAGLLAAIAAYLSWATGLRPSRELVREALG